MVAPITSIAMMLAAVVSVVDGHGRLVEPPSRSSMWRYGFNNPPNYNDHQLFCGGASVQWGKNGGKCGVCGDNFNGPLDNEAPDGKYARNGIIVKKYDVGAIMATRVHLTVNHKGWFEFRLCQNDVLKKAVKQECFDKIVLEDENGVSRFTVPAEQPRYYNYKLQLPQGVTCNNCVLQWKYNTGNSYGVDPVTGVGCVGCGPQEQFYGCSDIAIGANGIVVGEKNATVVVPKGDVDERTEWEKSQDGCKCPCSSAGDRMNYSAFYLLMCSIILKITA